MGFWRQRILPRLVDWATGVETTMRQRARVVPQVYGQVVELGFGSGHNLEFMDPERVDRLIGIDPAALGFRLAKPKIDAVDFEVEHLECSAEEIPLEDGTIDTVLATYALCTIPDPVAALHEVKRVLKADGCFVFCEHGLADSESLRKWQHRLQPIWGRVAGGCHLNRAIPEIIESAGFEISGLRTRLLPGPKPLTFTYWGTAR